MYLIRPIRLEDLDALIHFAQIARIGITNLPKNPDLLSKRLKASLHSFDHEVTTPTQESYLFVLENLQTRQVQGVTGLYARTAFHAPEYLYRIEQLTPPRFHPSVPKEIQLLHPSSISNGPSEIGSLYLDREARKVGIGRLLSLSRFLFVASFPQRFETTISALMRGYFDDQDNSPFWEGVGRRFLDLDYQALLRLREKSEAFIPSIVPQYPLYVSLLNPQAQAAINQVHINTRPALALLLQEGFAHTQEIDLFDGGPRICAPRDSIRTIRDSQTATIQIAPPLSEEPYLICNERLDFRACLGPLNLSENHVQLSEPLADALQLKPGDRIRYVALR